MKRINKFYFVIFIALIGVIGLLLGGCKNEDDSSSLDLYATNAHIDMYYVNESTPFTPVVATVTLKCDYNGDQISDAPKGIFIDKYIITPENVDGNVVAGAPSTTNRDTCFIPTNSSVTVTWDDFVVGWPDLKDYCDGIPAGGGFIYHFHFICHDYSGNDITADAYATFVWGPKPTK